MVKPAAALVWFRRDLRIVDNAALSGACSSNASHVLPVYFLDPSDLAPRWKPDGVAVPKLGPYRCRFLLQALDALHKDLRERGSQLYFQMESPQAGLKTLVRKLVEITGCQHVELYYHMDVLPESVTLEQKVEGAFRAVTAELGVSCEVHPAWGLTLYHPDDLPPFNTPSTGSKRRAAPTQRESGLAFNDAKRYEGLPPVMTQFRKAVQAVSPVRECLPAPVTVPPFPAGLHSMDSKEGCIPTHVRQLYRECGAEGFLSQLEELTGPPVLEEDIHCGTHDPRSAFPFRGGEAEGMDRLRYYIWGHTTGMEGGKQGSTPAVQYFKNTRMQAYGVDNSTKLSPFIALGCLSPRMVHAEVTRLQAALDSDAAEGAKPDPEMQCQWLIMHLCIRDFFIFTALKEGDTVTTDNGIQGQPVEWKTDMKAFKRWASGQTGFPFVDACMKELAATGYMSNRGRQNVASFLTKDLKIHWKLGAALFESLLLDHDAAVNFCNWNYFAGIGNDPRNRHFKTVTQGMKYDADALLIRSWLPQFQDLPPELCHMPFRMSADDAEKYSFDLLREYVEPLVDPTTQIGKLPND